MTPPTPSAVYPPAVPGNSTGSPRPPQVEILADGPALVARALVLTTETIRAAVRERGRCWLALSGGSTPEPLYRALAQADLPWADLWVLWGDERYVPADHPDSNQRMARRAWLDHVPIPAAQILPWPTEAGDPAADAVRYEQWLGDRLGVGALPQLDCVLLGMGDDGHTASLFPHTAALEVRDRLVAVGEKDGQPRLTLTYAMLNAARQVLFLVAGASKRPALAQIFAACEDPSISAILDRTYPARAIRPQGELRWLLDRAAAEALDLEGGRSPF